MNTTAGRDLLSHLVCSFKLHPSEPPGEAEFNLPDKVTRFTWRELDVGNDLVAVRVHGNEVAGVGVQHQPPAAHRGN